MSTASTSNLQESTRKDTMRNRRLDYPPLKDFNVKSCSVVEIGIPDIDTSVVNKVRFTHEKATYHYHAQETKQVVKFRVVYVPLDSKEGTKLIPLAKELVEKVLEDSYEPKTATILQTGKDASKPIMTKSIGECVITGATIEIDAGDYVRIAFELTGILASSDS